jgi:predicted DNA-binding protein
MLAIRLDEVLEARLATLARVRRRTKSELVREAVVRMLDDVEDLELAERALAASKSTKPLAKLRKELGLDR